MTSLVSMPGELHRLLRALRAATLAAVILLGLGPAEARAAITFVKNVGASGTTSTGVTLAVTVPATGVAAGNTVIVTFAMNPATGAVSCADSKLNVYAMDVDVANGSGTSGVRTIVCSSRVTTALVSGDTITVAHPSVTARAMSANEFSGLASAALDRTATGTGSSADPATNATAATNQADELLIGGIATEGKASDGFTAGSGYTALTTAGSGEAGMPTGHVAIFPEYRIVDATGTFVADGTLGASRVWAATIATYRASCGNGTVDAGEQCDPGTGGQLADDCCTGGCQFETVGTVCRDAAGECDLEETCTGGSSACPVDAKVDPGTPCTDDGETCTADVCDGVGDACTHPAGNAGTICRASGGECDLEETCDGLGTTCPADDKVGAGTPCTDDGETCTADVCDGVGDACTHPAGNAGTICRASGGECDPSEACDGVSTTCPADAKAGAGTPCTDDGETCTADVCDGVGDACTHPAGNAGTVCRAAAGDCDVAETCDGASPSCPADGFVGAGTECRAAGGVCDVAETCTGGSADCPADGKSTAECRASAGECDVAETCDGVGDDCPADGFVSAGTECRAAAGDCDVAESCTGSEADCPADGKSTAECRAAAGDCDVAESCDGVGDDCPADEAAPDGTACDDDLFCNGADTCLAGSCDDHAGDPCAGGAECDDSCDEDVDSCAVAAGTPCTDDGNECTDDACDGLGACAHPANTAPCDDGNSCTVADQCLDGTCEGDPATCGDGTLQAECGEECDDGNTADGDGCSMICSFEAGCPAAPATGCRLPVVAAKGQLQVKDKGGEKDQIQWKWLKGAATTREELGDPLTTTSYDLCIYDGTGTLVAYGSAPAGGLCAGKPCWQAKEGKPTVKYKDKEGTPDGLTGIGMKAGVDGKAQFVVKGKGAALNMPAIPMAQPVTVQMRNSDGLCWESVFSAPAKKNELGQFNDKSD